MRINCKTTLFIIFIGSLFSDNLFGARSLTPPPDYEKAVADDDDKKEDDEDLKKHPRWSKLAEGKIPPLLSRRLPYSSIDSVVHVTPETIFYRQNRKLLLYNRGSKEVAAADPFATPNYEDFEYLPRGGTQITATRVENKCIFNIVRSDGSRMIVPSPVESSRPQAVDLSPDAKLLAYFSYCFWKSDNRDRITAIVINTATGEEVTRLKYPVGNFLFLSNNLLHTDHHIYDMQNNAWHKAVRDKLSDKIGLDSDHYAAIEVQPDEKSRKIYFMKTVHGSFESDKKLQTIETTATKIKFASRTNMILANHQFMRFFRGTPARTKLAFDCLGQITFPSADGSMVLTPLSPDSAFVIHKDGVRLVTKKDLEPLTAEQKADHFDFNT